jgi:hypothetical protein
MVSTVTILSQRTNMKLLICLIAGVLACGAESAVAATCEAVRGGSELKSSIINLEPSQHGTRFNGGDSQYKIEMITEDQDIAMNIEDLDANSKISMSGSFNSSGAYFFVLESLKPDFHHLIITCKR